QSPTDIFPSRPVKAPVSIAEWAAGQELCFSGVKSGVQCGKVVDGDAEYAAELSPAVISGPMLGIKVEGVAVEPGDSGGAGGNTYTGRAGGIASAGSALSGDPNAHIYGAPLEPLPVRLRTGTYQRGSLLALSNQAAPLALAH